jgi:hypothetical protein
MFSQQDAQDEHLEGDLDLRTPGLSRIFKEGLELDGDIRDPLQMGGAPLICKSRDRSIVIAGVASSLVQGVSDRAYHGS